MIKPILLSTEQQILDYLESELEIIDKNKNEYGEVFTPLSLINEILDELPKSIWLNRDVKWLDPAAGIGHFSIVVYLRLVKSLAHAIPNETERKRHILKNMLYMVELNPANVRKMRHFFGAKDANISLADFLENAEKWKRDLGTSEFHVILGNPPYQSKKEETYKGGAGNRTLWDKFITESLNSGYLRDNGFLAFITPAGWRRPESDLYNLMTRDNRLTFLHIYGKQAGLDIFHAESRFDVYILQKGKHAAKTKKVIDEHGKVYRQFDILSWPFLPNFAYDKIRKILVKPERGIPIIFDSSRYYAQKLSEKKTAKFKYPVIHGITQDGLGIRYADERDDSQFGVPKVVLNFNERQYPYIDNAGQYGMSQLSFGIPIRSKTQGEQWSRAILSPFFEEILRATKWGAFQTDYRMFKYFDAKMYKKREMRETVNNKKKTNKRGTLKIRGNPRLSESAI